MENLLQSKLFLFFVTDGHKFSSNQLNLKKRVITKNYTFLNTENRSHQFQDGGCGVWSIAVPCNVPEDAVTRQRVGGHSQKKNVVVCSSLCKVQ